MNILESIVFGLFSGLSDVLPVSSQAHKAIILKIFGEHEENPILRLFIHIAILAALYYSCSSHIMRIVRQIRLSKIPKRKRKRPLDVQTLMEFRLVRTMIIPVLLSLLLYNKTAPWGTKLYLTAVFLLLNGVILLRNSFLRFLRLAVLGGVLRVFSGFFFSLFFVHLKQERLYILQRGGDLRKSFLFALSLSDCIFIARLRVGHQLVAQGEVFRSHLHFAENGVDHATNAFIHIQVSSIPNS